MSSSKKITLKCYDGETFEVEEEVAMQSGTIKHMIEDNCTDNGVPIPIVSGIILAKVIEYCKKHAEAATASSSSEEKNPNDENNLKAWDADFAKVDQAVLYDLIMAANYLDIKGLMDLMCQTVADMIRGKSPSQIRKILNIENDFTPEEKEEIRKESKRVFG